MNISIQAEITGISYTPLLCRKLKTYDISQLSKAFDESASFLVRIDQNKIFAISWWVSPKRTRSYPYARVYDTLCYLGKKVTIIPIIKDEGADGDRDFLQWDTVSLMSLLGVYVIIAYYSYAEKSPKYLNKITNQRFDMKYLIKQLKVLTFYHSDALHWNIDQLSKASALAKMALDAYTDISKKLGVKMHSYETAMRRIKTLEKGVKAFKEKSRELAEKAQKREAVTIQPKELVKGEKGTITIKNYLGGYYYFTVDEVEVKENKVFLIEAKHSKTSSLPSEEDIKDGLLKMVLYANLKNVKIDDMNVEHIPVLKLTSSKHAYPSPKQLKTLKKTVKEATINNFLLYYNDRCLVCG